MANQWPASFAANARFAAGFFAGLAAHEVGGIVVWERGGGGATRVREVICVCDMCQRVRESRRVAAGRSTRHFLGHP